MSLKNSALVAAAATALGITVSANPICEALVNDKSVTQFTVYEVDASGRVLVIAAIGGVNRPIADSMGDVRLYASAVAAVTMAKRNGGGVPVSVVPFVKVPALGDPVKALIAKHKAFKSEQASGAKSVTAITSKLSAAVALGWDTATGTPEADEYADLVKRQTSINEWKAYADAQVTALTASLTAAGIDPVTYAPV